MTNRAMAIGKMSPAEHAGTGPFHRQQDQSIDDKEQLRTCGRVRPAAGGQRQSTDRELHEAEQDQQGLEDSRAFGGPVVGAAPGQQKHGRGAGSELAPSHRNKGRRDDEREGREDAVGLDHGTPYSSGAPSRATPWPTARHTQAIPTAIRA